MIITDSVFASVKKYIRLARFDHWIKQLFMIPGVVVAVIIVHDSGYNWSLVLKRFPLDFLALCLIASANYVLNEWLDAAFDRFHPVKKNRTSVTEHLDARIVYLEYAVFAVAGLLFGWAASPPVLIVCAALLLMGVVYNVKPLRVKDVPFLDVLAESVNNALRLLAGWFVVTSVYLPPATLLFGYWMGGAFLMAAKRFAEYRMFSDPEMLARYRKSFKRYTEKSLMASAAFYGMLSLFFCGIFIIKYRVEFLLAIPVICGLFAYYLALCYRYDSLAQKPEALYREKGLMLYILLLAALFFVLSFIDIPFLSTLQDTVLIQSGTI
ncbi:MAG: UbiA family prenyltransferase [Bacillota bacterium]